MDSTKNLFKKFLIDEIMRKSNANLADAIHQVNKFAKSPKFAESCEKWKKVHLKSRHKSNKPKSAAQIVAGMF